jgi:endonuclease III
VLAQAHLLLKKHGQEICLRSEPICHVCPVSGECPAFAATERRKGS